MGEHRGFLFQVQPKEEEPHSEAGRNGTPVQARAAEDPQLDSGLHWSGIQYPAVLERFLGEYWLLDFATGFRLVSPRLCFPCESMVY